MIIAVASAATAATAATALVTTRVVVAVSEGMQSLVQ
jgi:hypothetical protein